MRIHLCEVSVPRDAKRVVHCEYYESKMVDVGALKVCALEWKDQSQQSVHIFVAKQSSPATSHGGAWVERRYSFYSFLTSALDGGEWSASRPGRGLPRGKDPLYTLDRRLGGPQSRSGHRSWRKNPLPMPGIEPRSTSRTVHSQTLYWLSYPGSHTYP
jgi:hypothetical protein